jgi:hypothetical protein
MGDDGENIFHMLAINWQVAQNSFESGGRRSNDACKNVLNVNAPESVAAYRLCFTVTGLRATGGMFYGVAFWLTSAPY